MIENQSIPRPLIPFGPTRLSGFALDRDLLGRSVEQLNVETRQLVASYLRAGSMVLALMEYATDVLSGSFGVSGGSAVRTDGRYYWRKDAGEYVATYGIAIEEAAIEWMLANDWVPPFIELDDIARIDEYLSKILTRSV